MCKTSAAKIWDSFGVEQPSKPPIYAFYKQHWGTGCLCKDFFAAKFMNGTEIKNVICTELPIA
jgi:hypothetical protein